MCCSLMMVCMGIFPFTSPFTSVMLLVDRGNVIITYNHGLKLMGVSHQGFPEIAGNSFL